MYTKELRKFGFSLGLGLNILGFIMFYRHKEHFIWFLGIGSIILIVAILYPKALRPIKKVLDAVIFSINWLITMVSMVIVFYLIVTPIAILLRFLKKDPLDQKIKKGSSSYWLKKKNLFFSRGYYERMG